MNKWMLTAAGLLFLTTGVHVFLGGPEIHVPIQESELHPAVRAVGAVVWHAVTVMLLVFGAACAWLARNSNAPLAWLMIATQIGFAGLFIGYGMTLLGNLTVMPQWIIFALISAIIGIGIRADKAPASSRGTA
ncbi:hypothetical protein [uncultured Shimia sp.]|uniref:hypothetical protein n=1 Tax=uncultured Shimia sp. TaxID=573152 RepID=UPI0026095A9F|nr:hypothetical protein [uncultured Shimia sp.]